MKSASKITLIYFLISFCWILFSDRFISTLSKNPAVLTDLQTYKGWFFVLGTSVFLYLIIRAEWRRKNRLVEELKQAKSKAEQNERLKTTFLSNLSHEIRTPLNGILGFSQLLYEDHDSGQLREMYMQQLNRNSDMLLRIIHNTIEISKIQEKLIQPIFQETDAHSVLTGLEQTYTVPHSELQQKGLQFRVETDTPGQPLVFRTDIGCLNQILINLLDNAVKFTPIGTIVLGCRAEAGYLRFFVRDSGIGIAPEELETIFNRYTQNKRDEQQQSGFGLGLTISKGLADLLDARIEVESTLGKGSCFSVLIPLWQPENKTAR